MSSLQRQIREGFEQVPFKKGQLIFSEGNFPLALYFIDQGKVKIYKHGRSGKEQIISILGDGHFLGYDALLTRSRYSVSASTVEASTLYMLPGTDLPRFMQEHRELGQRLLQTISGALEEAEQRITSLAYKPVRGRLAETLLNLQETYQDGLIMITRTELAQMTGTAKETIIRLLAEFRAEGIIRQEGKHIRVLRPELLSRINLMYE